MKKYEPASLQKSSLKGAATLNIMTLARPFRPIFAESVHYHAKKKMSWRHFIFRDTSAVFTAHHFLRNLRGQLAKVLVSASLASFSDIVWSNSLAFGAQT
jgi:hypothetical protein